MVATRHFARPRGSGPAAGVTAAVARRPVRAQIAISQYVADHIDGDSAVVHPGIDDRPEGVGAAGRDRSILLVQRLEPEKRTDLGILAFAASGLPADGWRLVVAGDGSQRGDLETIVAREGLGEHVELLGARSDVDALMQRAGILLAPCPVEGLGLSVLEAMANALPVVAAGAGGHLETLGGLEPLALYPPTDIARAGEHLAVLAASPSAATPTAARHAPCSATGSHRAHRWQGRQPCTAASSAAPARPMTTIGARRRDGQPGSHRPRARGGLPRVLGHRVATQPVPRHRAAARGPAPPGPLRRAGGRPSPRGAPRVPPRPGRGLRLAGPVEGVGPDQLWLYQPTKVLPAASTRRSTSGSPPWSGARPAASGSNVPCSGSTTPRRRPSSARRPGRRSTT
ncbi:glycosyltransferase [Oerskovia sp. M15]